MAATAMTSAPSRASYFYVWMGVLCAMFAFGAFAGTYWLQLAGGTFVGGSPLLHLHGLLNSAWTLLLVAQAWRAANGRLEHHKAWGVAGVSLATAIVIIGIAVANNAVASYLARGYGDNARGFYFLPLEAIAGFAVFFVAALANLARPDWHKRFMLVATVSLLQAAGGRIGFLLATGGGPGLRPGLGRPPTSGLDAIAFASLILLVGVIYDWRTRGRPHPAYVIGLATLFGVELARPWITGNPGWPAFVDAMGRFG